MNCQRCKKRVATVHLTEIKENEKHEVHLCNECAAKQGVHVQAPEGLKFLTGLINQQIGQELAAMAGLRCPNCGHTFLAFRTQRRLGCPRDYEVFEQGLKPLLEQVHGATEHIGRVPPSAGEEARRSGELARLQWQLKRAVDREDFEEATRLRNEIRQKG